MLSDRCRDLATVPPSRATDRTSRSLPAPAHPVRAGRERSEGDGAHRPAESRDPAEVRRFLQTDAAPVFSLSSVEVYRVFQGCAEELGFTDVLAPWPRHEGPFAGDEAVLDTVATDVLPALS